MHKLCSKKEITSLTILFMITYMVSYITRINFGGIISAIESAEQISRSLLSISVTGSFITYGAGQIVSGLIGDHFSPKKLVSLGFVVTTLMNLLIPFCKGPYTMAAVWCVNGFAQAFMWPPIVKLMTAHLTAEDYKTVTVKVLWGSSFGTIAVYLISPLIISTLGWKYVFTLSGIAGAVMLVFWNKFAHDAEPEVASSTPATASEKISAKVFLTPIILCVMLCIMCQGMLRDGVTTWMPSYISETYNMSNSISILTGVILPVFSIICVQLASLLYRRVFKKPLTCAGVMFGMGGVAAVVLVLFSGGNAALSVLMSALLTGCMHGVNLILVCMLPAYFKKFGNVSTAAGVLNACTYIGSAASTYGIALLSEKIGWSFTLISWVAVAVIGTVLCLVFSKAWERKFTENE